MNAMLARWKLSFHLKYSAWLLQGLSRITFWSDKFKQRLSPLGMGIVAGLVLTLVFGANIKLSSIYQAFALLSAVFLTSLLVVWFKSIWAKKKGQHGKWMLQRNLPAFATVGVPTSYHIILQNHSQKVAYDISVGEVMPLPKPSLFQFLHMQEPHENQRNWYDRHTGFYRFVWLQDWLNGAALEAQLVSEVAAGASTNITAQLLPLRRGYIHLVQLRLRFPEPLGLAYQFENYNQVDSLLVLPKAYQLPVQLLAGGSRAYQQGGVSQASHVGDSEEFSKLREYRDGDSPRHVFWPSLARMDNPLVKEYQDEFYARSALVLDNFGGEDKRSLFEEAISVAAGFAMHTESNELLLDLMYVGEAEQSEHLLAGRAIAHAEQMLETLATLEMSHGDFSSLKQSILMQAEKLSSCILILSAWDEPRQALVHQLRALSKPCLVFVLAEDEITIEEHSIDDQSVYVLRSGMIQQTLDAM